MAVKRTKVFVIYVAESAGGVRGEISQNATVFVSDCSGNVNDRFTNYFGLASRRTQASR
jgi:hypothetical protein